MLSSPDILPAINLLADFLQQTQIRNRWLETPSIQIYVRKGRHLDEQRDLLSTLNIANINTHPPGSGIFTDFITQVENMSHLPIYIENVLDPRFENFFRKRGYALIPYTDPPCYILHKAK